MPKRVGRHDELWQQLISDQNLSLAIDEVNGSHHWTPHHRPNNCTAWVEETKAERIRALRNILKKGFVQKPPHVTRRWDVSARKWRKVSVAGPICPPCPCPSAGTHFHARDGPIPVRKHQRARSPLRKAGNRKMDKGGPERDQVRIFRGHPPFLRQSET